MTIFCLWDVATCSIISRIYFTRRFLCIVSLLTYQGDDVIVLRALFCSICMMSIFDFLAQPNTSMLYDQILIMATLHSRNLLCKFNRDFLPRIEWSFFTLRSACFLFAVRWCFHVKILSKCMPKYFTQSLVFSVALFSFTSGVEIYLVVKITCVDLLESMLIFHFLAHVAISSKYVMILLR